MNTKILTSLILAAATQFAAVAATGDTVTPKFASFQSGNLLAMMQPFLVTAPRITPRDLQLKVVAEHDVRLLRNLTDQALANRFQAEFKAKGFQGNVDFLAATDAPIPTLPLLEIDLADWRASPGKLPDCEFSATLVTPKGTTSLGNFEGFSAPLAGAPTAKAQRNTLRDAANHAVDEVYQDLQAKHALPGVSQ